MQIRMTRAGAPNPDQDLSRPGSGTATSRTSPSDCHLVSWYAFTLSSLEKSRPLRNSAKTIPQAPENSTCDAEEAEFKIHRRSVKRRADARAVAPACLMAGGGADLGW